MNKHYILATVWTTSFEFVLIQSHFLVPPFTQYLTGLHSDTLHSLKSKSLTVMLLKEDSKMRDENK